MGMIVGKIGFGMHQIESHFDAIRNRMTDALLFEELYYRAEYENEKLLEEIAKLKGEACGRKVEGTVRKSRVVREKRGL